MSHPDTTEAVIPTIDMIIVKLRASSCWIDTEKLPKSASYNAREKQKSKIDSASKNKRSRDCIYLRGNRSDIKVGAKTAGSRQI